MKKSTWAYSTAIIGVCYAVVLWVETAWWFFPSELAHRATMGIGGVLLFIWSWLYFTLKD